MRLVFVLALASCASIAAATETADQRGKREQQNVDVMMSHYPPESFAAGE